MFVQWPLEKTFPIGRAGMVAAKHPLAAEAGVGILRAGGSAVDAAIATSLAAGVVEPYMSGLGGGGLAVFCPAGAAPVALHFGMQAPASAAPDMYQIIPGTFDEDLFGWPTTVGDANMVGPTSMAVPGQTVGLARLFELGGTMPWSELVAPAQRLASEGFAVDWLTSLRTLEGTDLLSRFPTSVSTYLPGGRPPKPELGTPADILTQRDLGQTLTSLAGDPSTVARDPAAASIEAASEGRITESDLAKREVLEGIPLRLSCWDVDVHLVPWATGGATMLEWLGIVEALDPPRREDDPRYWWCIVKAGEVAMRDRLEKLGDPSFVPFPDEILERSYHQRMAKSIEAGEVVAPDLPPAVGSTTHLSVVDAAGNAVSVTQTLLSLWGSGMVTPRTGICMNNGMMWFNPEPGNPNSIGPGKLPLANMCPCIVSRDGQPFLVYGASGGRRIMPALVQVLLRVLFFDDPLDRAIAAPRLEMSTQQIRADIRLGEPLLRGLQDLLERPVLPRAPILGASPWASPVGLMRLPDGSWTGGADPYTMACVLAA